MRYTHTNGVTVESDIALDSALFSPVEEPKPTAEKKPDENSTPKKRKGSRS